MISVFFFFASVTHAVEKTLLYFLFIAFSLDTEILRVQWKDAGCLPKIDMEHLGVEMPLRVLTSMVGYSSKTRKLHVQSD